MQKRIQITWERFLLSSSDAYFNIHKTSDYAAARAVACIRIEKTK